MKLEDIIKIIPPTTHPVALGGCYAEQNNFDCCVYDMILTNK